MNNNQSLNIMTEERKRELCLGVGICIAIGGLLRMPSNESNSDYLEILGSPGINLEELESINNYDELYEKDYECIKQYLESKSHEVK